MSMCTLAKATVATIGILLFGSSLAPLSAQATHTVQVSGMTFNPNSLIIAEGDTVSWVWGFGIHNVNSVNGFFFSGLPVAGPKTFNVVFDDLFLAANPKPNNLYGYQCDNHVAFGMVGTVRVVKPLLSVSNLVGGQVVTVTVENAHPNGPVGVAFSRTGPGPSSVPAGPCGMVMLDLSPPITVLPVSTADANGTWTFSRPLPARVSGRPVWIHGLDVRTCTLSNSLAEVIG